MVAYFLLDENWHFFAFLCSTDTPSIKYHGRLLGPGPLFGTREYGHSSILAPPIHGHLVRWTRIRLSVGLSGVCNVVPISDGAAK